MKIAGVWLLRAATQAVLAALTGGGHQALFVGGCVRNAVLGVAVADVDIATDAPPDRVVDLVGAAGLRALPTGIGHGTVTVISGGISHEVTTFRRDVKTDGRHAVVAFSGSLAEDAARRDFTMNALYARADGTVLDPLGGLGDLLARRVRFVGDAAARIREDRLRILRFFRFHACYGDPSGGLDADGLAACAANAAGLETLSRERVGAEMRKLLAAADPAPSVAAMAACGVLALILPGASALALPVLVHLEAGIVPCWLRRLAVIGGVAAETALRLSRREARALAVLRDGIGAGSGAGELAYRLGGDAALSVLLLRAALAGTELPDGWQSALATGAVARFPVGAADLMPGLGGQLLGQRLAELETRWIASGFTLSRAELLAGTA